MMSNQSQTLSMELLPTNQSKVFQCADNLNNISKRLQGFYEQKEFSDIVLIATLDNTKVQAHRLVLSASCDYFLAMFRSTLKEATADEVEIKKIDGVSLQLIIDFMYTGSIELRNEIVENVLRAADLFQMQTLITACCDFMGEQLDVSNCLGIAMFAELHSYLELKTKSLAFAYKHFGEVCNSKEFLLLNKEELTQFITTDDQCVRSEDKLFLSVVKWIEYDKDREEHIFDLISLLRFKCLDPRFIIENRHSVCKTMQLCELTCTWLQWHLSAKIRDQQATTRKIAVATEPEFLSNRISIWTFDPNANIWLKDEIILSHQDIQSDFVIGIDKILVVGGHKRDYYSSVPYPCFDFESNICYDMPPISQLNVTSMAELNGELYAFGEYTGQIPLTGTGQSYYYEIVLQKYNFYTRQWKDVKNLPHRFEKFQLTALRGLLYLVGDGHPSMQCYDPVKDTWVQKASKKVVPEKFGLAAVCGHLYAVGGISNEKNCVAVERYNPLDDTWTVIGLQVQGGITQCVSINNLLIIFFELKSTVMEYNPITDETKMLGELPHTSDKRYLLTKC